MNPPEQDTALPERADEPDSPAEIVIRRLDKIETTAFSQGNSA
ncbi:hypothetical protein [Planotetraspora sp. GP83]